MDNQTPKRKPGAPLGNRNALKHGLYSRFFTRQENQRLDKGRLGKLDDEENGLSIMFSRILESMQEENMDHDRYLAAARVLALVGGRIESIHRTRKAIYEKLTAMEQAMEELKFIPLEED